MKRLIVANWKMNPPTLDEARRIASQIEHGLLGVARELVEVAICPPFVFLPMVKHAIHFARLGAQDLASESAGPYTGEVSADQLLEFGVSLVLVGHSERRALLEDDKLLSRKMRLALEKGLEPVFCVGFGTKKGMPEAEEKKIIMSQLRRGLKDINARKSKFAVLYEPVWAISRGYRAGAAVPPSHAAYMMKWIKSRFPKNRVLYGGSIDGRNAAGFAAESVVEGGVVGGASLKPQDFLEIIKAFANP